MSCKKCKCNILGVLSQLRDYRKVYLYDDLAHKYIERICYSMGSFTWASGWLCFHGDE